MAANPSGDKRLRSRSLGLKLLLVGALIILLGAPLLFVGALFWERSARADAVAREIGAAEGGPQFLRGPLLAIPVDVNERVTISTPDGLREEIQRRRETVFISAETLDIDIDIATQTRRRAIYEVPVYEAHVQMDARFAPEDLESVLPEDAEPFWSEASLLLAISDLRGVAADVALDVTGPVRAGRFAPTGAFDRTGGYAMASNWRTVAAPLAGAAPGEAFGLSLDLRFSGAQQLRFAASGRETAARIVADWPHPGFDGAYLPETREVSADGFTAGWRVPFLARGAPAIWRDGAGYTLQQLDQTGFGVNFVTPTDGYVRVGRALKYAFFFTGFTLLMIFLVEASGARRVHAAQYLLLGLAQVIFYLLLLAVSEHADIARAYLAAAGATVALSALYAAATFKSAVRGLLIFAVLAFAYALQYALILMEDYALLIGSAVAFAALALTMLVTRNVDWHAVGQAESDAPASG